MIDQVEEEYREHGRYRYSNASSNRDKRLYDPQALKVASQPRDVSLRVTDFRLQNGHVRSIKPTKDRNATSRYTALAEDTTLAC